MQKIYVLSVQGYGDSESEFANVGVYDTAVKVSDAQTVILKKAAEEDVLTVTKIEFFTLNA